MAIFLKILAIFTKLKKNCSINVVVLDVVVGTVDVLRPRRERGARRVHRLRGALLGDGGPCAVRGQPHHRRRRFDVLPDSARGDPL